MNKVFKCGYFNVMLGSDHRSAGTGGRGLLFSSSSWPLTFANKWTYNKLKSYVIVIIIINLIKAWFHINFDQNMHTTLHFEKIGTRSRFDSDKKVPLRGWIRGHHVQGSCVVPTSGTRDLWTDKPDYVVNSDLIFLVSFWTFLHLQLSLNTDFSPTSNFICSL